MPPIVINLTTEVPVAKTVREIEDVLAAHGVHQLTKQYDAATKRLTGLSFVVDTQFGPREFRLPVRTEALYRRIHGARKRIPWGQEKAVAARDREQAERVAWRVLLDWLRAHLSVVALDMPLEEALLPWMVDIDSGETTFGLAQRQLALPKPEGA